MKEPCLTEFNVFIFIDHDNLIGMESEVITIGKRTGKYRSWEPIFIGTHSDPLYDERLSWEGRSDKMTHVSIHSNSNIVIRGHF